MDEDGAARFADGFDLGGGDDAILGTRSAAGNLEVCGG
jgi:hypothetical protein